MGYTSILRLTSATHSLILKFFDFTDSFIFFSSSFRLTAPSSSSSSLSIFGSKSTSEFIGDSSYISSKS